MVELAVAMPLLLLTLLTTIDVGRAFFDYTRMRSGVVEGATYGQRMPFDTGGIVSAAQTNGVPTAAAISVTADAACAVPGGTGKVRVQATQTFTPIFFGTLSAVTDGGSWSFTLRAHETMRCLT
jgi:Flp pilus assembly protein TadG